MATFKTHVYVTNTETGEAGWFHPGDEVPDWATGYVDEEVHVGEPEESVEEETFEAYPELHQEGEGNVFEEGGSQNYETKQQVAEEEATGEAAGDYESMTSQQLSDLLAERGLPTSGTKAEKIQRLQDDDMSMQ